VISRFVGAERGWEQKWVGPLWWEPTARKARYVHRVQFSLDVVL
jgi:hypothetical protein